MVKKFKAGKPSRSSGGVGSFAPRMILSRDGADALNMIRFDIRDRVKRGGELAALEAMGLMLKEIQRTAPDDVGGVRDYAKSLKVGIVESGRTPVVMIFMEDVKRKLTEDDSEDTVVYVSTEERSPASAKVIQSYQPWPSALLPFQPSGRGVTVVSRQVSRSEISRISARILSKRASIESALNRAGARGAKIQKGNNGVGTEVSEDLAFSVLRREFGLGDKSEPHWRPAAKKISGDLRQLGKRLVEYVMTGRESVFSLPPHVSVSTSDVAAFTPFQAKIASASGLK